MFNIDYLDDKGDYDRNFIGLSCIFSDTGDIISGEWIDGIEFDASNFSDMSIENVKSAGEYVGILVGYKIYNYDGYLLQFDTPTSTDYGGYLVEYVPQVPEPSTYAAIFGALALGFVAFRRRK